MDPVNYTVHSLPIIEYTELEAPRVYYTESDNYSEFIQEFTEYVSGDCHAITCDDEIIYNAYKKTGIREKIIEDRIRSDIIKDCHASIFVHLLREKKDAKVIVYMFGQNPWFLACYYDSAYGIMTVESYKSKKFQEVFELNHRN